MINPTVQIYESIINNKKTIIFAAFQDNTMIGVLDTGNIDANSLWLSSLHVKEDFRKNGIGTLLLKKSFEFAKENNCEAVSFSTKKTNKAILSICKKLDMFEACDYEKDDNIMMVKRL